MRGLAEVTGSRSSQIVGWSPGDAFAVHHNFDGSIFETWLALGGATDVNPLVRVGRRLPVLGAVSEHEIMSSDERRRSAIWNIYETAEIPHVRSGKAWSDGTHDVMFSVLRSAREGPIAGEALRAFDRLVRVAASVVRVRRVFGAESARLVAGALDAVAAPALVLDGFGRVIDVSQAAGSELRPGGPLSLAQGRLRVGDQRADAALQAAIRRLLSAARGGGGTGIDAVVELGPVSLHLALAPAAANDPLGAAPRLIALLEPGGLGVLTEAERRVAESALKGLGLADIARARGVSIETVRSQLKAVYGKLGVNGRAGLQARFGRASRRSLQEQRLGLGLAREP